METTAAANNLVDGIDIKALLDHEPSHKKQSTFSPDLEVFVISFKKGHEIIRHNFQAESLATAVKLGQDFCAKRRHRFIVVTPFLRDLKRMMEQEEN